ncbi:hypothetical protein [Hymenobacter ruricola]|uniref:Uncharacterized protein n=1 Tax=Hymenobacter ruricola TaxID=2791023 RepID=A0ABS0I3R8_9BACT|nr:hypothetical protein [Hymenobacter ruricola]MBF9221368.1 hypothetical protein [Hymenobacter ruricola]
MDHDAGGGGHQPVHFSEWPKPFWHPKPVAKRQPRASGETFLAAAIW